MLPSNSVGFNEDMNESGVTARTFPASGRSLSEWTQTRAGLAPLQTANAACACMCATPCNSWHARMSLRFRPCVIILFYFFRQCANFVHSLLLVRAVEIRLQRDVLRARFSSL